MSYAKVLGATNRKDGYLEGNGYLVSWCVGHLVELAPPNIYDARYVKWSIADLPILPERWQYLVSSSTKKQFGILQKLMHRPDVDSIVNSCDAGREGELIFRLVYQQAGCKKPFSRLWLSSMEESAIREGFAHLKPSTEYDALYNAALCRERADWMVGINASRLFSCLYGQPLAVGRVMTPVLAMTVVREAAIAAFVPEKFYTVDLELTSGCTASSRRIPEKSVAEKLLEACRREMVATIQRITRKEKSENPPLLYDLTTLQRDANRLLGYSAQQTLDYVQSLYEKKLTTYPRTDSCYITDDDEEMLEELTEELERFLDITPADADEAVPRTRRTVNREKVTDHHAILPTRSMLQADLEALPKGERNVLKLIIARTLMAVSKPFRYLETLLTTECAGEEFTAKGKEILEEGWKAVERKVLADILNRKQELTALPNAAENECGIRKSRISSLRLPDGETRRKGARTTKNLWVSKLRCRCGSSYRIFNWRKLKDGTPVFGYQCNMRTVNPTRSFVLEHNMTQQLSCDAISIPEWKLELMAKKIFEKVWGNQNKAILRACKMIESCQNGKATARMSAAPIRSQIEKIKKRKLNYAAMRADGELPREEYQALCKQADDEIAHLEQELKALSPASEPQTVSSDMKAIYDFLSQKVDVHGARLAPELIDQFVEVVTPIADCSYRWKLNTGCKKSKEERADLMAVSEKPILTFTIDFETAKRYREANKMPHQFRRAAWTDLTVEVYL